MFFLRISLSFGNSAYSPPPLLGGHGLVGAGTWTPPATGAGRSTRVMRRDRGPDMKGQVGSGISPTAAADLGHDCGRADRSETPARPFEPKPLIGPSGMKRSRYPRQDPPHPLQEAQGQADVRGPRRDQQSKDSKSAAEWSTASPKKPHGVRAEPAIVLANMAAWRGRSSSRTEQEKAGGLCGPPAGSRKPTGPLEFGGLVLTR